MKHFNYGNALLGAWGLNISSFMMHTLPYLQFTSLILAMSASIVTIIQLTKKQKSSSK